MSVKRVPGNPGRSKRAIYNGLVTLVSTDASRSPTLKEQTRKALTALDAALKEAGTDKKNIVNCLVYITDMTKWQEMQDSWMEWVDEPNAPVRACVQVGLAPGLLIEIVCNAAM